MKTFLTICAGILILILIIAGCSALVPKSSPGVTFQPGREALVPQEDRLVLWMRGETYQYYIISETDGDVYVDTFWRNRKVDLDQNGCGTFHAQLIYPIRICQTSSGLEVTWPVFLRPNFLSLY